ncbi:hypothetical protein [Oceanimonas marisflavi]|uniref:hypothetical protein n=1 Tax=Oceanimonas marisflavi TaxID=2059724 RepID=UPI001300565C|nr:hypothetical protein [Oceanimonas marisflavi]
MEWLLYELRPYGCAAIGLLVLFADIPQPGPVAGIVLIMIGLYLHIKRARVRREYPKTIRKPRW